MNTQTKLAFFAEEEYKALCEEYKELVRKQKETKARISFLEEQIIEKSGGVRMQHGVQVYVFKRKGSIDYKAIPAVKKMSESQLDKFRKPSISKLCVKTY